MKHLVKVKDFNFGSIKCDIYENKKGDFFVTRQQIGQALEYSNPQKAIDNLHNNHKERLDKFSVTLKLRGTDNKLYDTILYSAKGIYEICRWSKQPKADLFYDSVYEILEGLRLGYLKLEAEKQTVLWQNTRIESKRNRLKETDEIKALIEYAKANGSRNADKYYITFSKLANKAVGLDSNQRNHATTNQLNNLILIENIINHVIKEGLERQAYYKEIYKSCRERIEQFKYIAYLEKIA